MKIYLPSTAHSLAEELAREQITPEKSKSIYLNTLAVYAVDCYLQTFDIVTDFSQGDWRNSLWRSLLDTSDLSIPDVGKIECRPILPHQTHMSIPNESEEVVGYVAVQFSETLDAVELVGFAPIALVSGKHQITLKTLQPLETLFDHLTPVVRLWRWAQGIVDRTWQTLDDAFEDTATQLYDLAHSPEMAFRSSRSTPEIKISRFRQITVSHQHLKLIINLIFQDSPTKIQIVVKVCPIEDSALISPDLQLIVSAGETTLRPVSREIDNFIEKCFTGEPGEHFNLQIVQGDAVFTESYEI